jgi:hypothetical protein
LQVQLRTVPYYALQDRTIQQVLHSARGTPTAIRGNVADDRAPACRFRSRPPGRRHRRTTKVYGGAPIHCHEGTDGGRSPTRADAPRGCRKAQWEFVRRLPRTRYPTNSCPLALDSRSWGCESVRCDCRRHRRSPSAAERGGSRTAVVVARTGPVLAHPDCPGGSLETWAIPWPPPVLLKTSLLGWMRIPGPGARSRRESA